MLETVKLICPYCGGATLHAFSTKDINRGVSNVVFQANRCTDCDLLFVTNPPDDLERYYTEDFHPRTSNVEDIIPHQRWQEYRLELVKKYARIDDSGELLDIGPSAGVFLSLAKRAGFNLSAIEINEQCVTFLRDKLGVDAIHSGDPAKILNESSRTYDVICMWHSLEHLPRPWDAIKAASERLNEDGILLIACPNPKAWQASVMGKRWTHWDLPRHLYAMSIPWIINCGKKSGLVTELATTTDTGSMNLNRAGWSALISQFWPSNILKTPAIRLVSWAAKLLTPLDGREGLGSAYCIIFRRPKID